MTDEEEIRHLLAQYVQCADSGDARGRSDLFADDAVYLPSAGRYVGRPAIYQAIADRLAAQPRRHTKHVCANSLISIDGNAAQAATDFVLYTRQGEEPWQINQAGRYFDRFVRREGRWWYAENHPVQV